MPERRNVLLTSAGKGVGIVRQVREAMDRLEEFADQRLFVSSSDAFTPARCFADGFVHAPLSDDPQFIDQLLAACATHDIGVVIPLSDLDLARCAPHVAAVAASGTTVVCPRQRVVDLCLDKLAFAEFARENELDHPQTWRSTDLERLSFPLFYKRRFGSGSVGAGVCRSREEAGALIAAEPDLLFQPVIAAPEITVDAYVSRHGACVAAVQRVRDTVVGGQAYQSHTVNVPAVARLAERTIAALARVGLRGPLNVQIFHTPAPVLVEVNTRLGSAAVLSNVACNGRLLEALLREATGGVATGDPSDYRVALYLSRYLGDIIHDGQTIVSTHPGWA